MIGEAPCICDEGKTCGYHFFEFLGEQGLPEDHARTLTTYELFGEEFVG